VTGPSDSSDSSDSSDLSSDPSGAPAMAVDDGPVGDGPVVGGLADLLRAEGVDEAEIAEADRNHHLSLLVVERLARPERSVYDLDEMAVATGLTPELISRMWRSLGLTVPRAGDRAFNEADVDLLGTVGRLLQSEVIDHDLTLQMSRVIGSSASRVANALVDAVEAGDVPAAADDESAQAAVAERQARSEEFSALAPLLVPTLMDIMGLVWRRHLQAAARARVVREQAGAHPAHLVVGFADLVGFTALSQQIGPHELADVVERFETLAYDTIGNLGGRVVKMIGDEVMFAVPHERAAAEIALSLAEGYAAHDDLPDVRVGLASGPVLQREADVFGPVVNLASRLVTLAFPATVLCANEVREALEGDVDFACRPIGTRKVKDIGKVPLHVLRRAEAAMEPRSRNEQAEDRWAERQEARVAEIDERRAGGRRRSRREARGDDTAAAIATGDGDEPADDQP
jgi:adenylate cyclase